VFFKAGIFAWALAATQFACQNKAVGAPPRYVFLRFENLSGDPSMEWIGRAASEALSVSLSSALNGPVIRPGAAPGVSSERSKAILAGATRAIAGYVERAGDRVRITAVEQDLSTGKTLRTVTAADPSPMAALTELARGLSPASRALPTANATAMRAYSAALDSAGQATEQLLEESLRNDPGFGAVWVTLASYELAQGDRTRAASVIERARRQKLDALSQANLDLEATGINGDRPGRINALRKIANLSPGDPALLRSLAEAEIAAGQFTAAVSDWQRVTAALPDDPVAWNSLGYARSYAGDYAGALAALQEYERLQPKEANPSDSIGDLNYSFRKFNEAATAYLAANSKQPGFNQYADLYKTAWASFNAGDKSAADKLFADFRAAREKEVGGPAPLLTADWLYRTGRKPEGLAALRKFATETNSAPLRASAFSLSTIWDLLEGNRAQAGKDSAADGINPLVRFAALPSASAEEWKARADHMIPQNMASLRPLALGYALLLDGKSEAALPVWEQIVNAGPATDFFARAIYTRLQGKQPGAPLLPDIRSFNPFLAVLDYAQFQSR
jgi:cytochrome c-type biogenesis protein CcmH/NrfG/TolB-like protein